MPSLPRRLLIALVLLLAPTLVLAYGVAVHELLPGRVLAGLSSVPPGTPNADLVIPPTLMRLDGVTDADLSAFRLFLYERAGHLADTALRRRFLARYPAPAAFTARAMKELLMMNGAARVLGVDSFAAVYRAMPPKDRQLDPHPDYRPGQPLTVGTALELGSIYPDLDRRNQGRLWRDDSGAPARTPAGDSVPFDPMTLNMGKRTGLSSQAHAHYGLNRHAKSSDPGVLKTAPWDFAIATSWGDVVETYAPDNAQLYTDLALLSALDGRPGWRTLGTLYAGNAMHYLADVGNAVHTIQVGIYPIFVDATIQSWLSRLTTLFGLLGKPRDRNAIGLDIISNLHTLSEELFQAELTTALAEESRGRFDSVPPSMRSVVDLLRRGDDSLSRVLASSLEPQPVAPFGRVIAEAVVDANFRDGAEVYRVTREIADSRLRVGRFTVDFDTLPDDQVWRFIRVRRGAIVHTALDRFNEVHGRGLARTASALRAWWLAYDRATHIPVAQRRQATDVILARLIAERLRYLDAADARRAAWLTQHQGATPR